MRLFLLAALLFPALASAQNVTRQGYTGGTEVLGGCTGINATDSNTLEIGQCYQNGVNSSIQVNDCGSNGVITLTPYTGSATCDPAFATTLQLSGERALNQSFCNVDSDPVAYNTYSCSSYTQPTTQQIHVTAFPKQFGATTCAGVNVTIPIPSSTCTSLPNTKLWVKANCASGLVTGVLYDNENCLLSFNSTGAVNISAIIPIGPYAQFGAASAQGKPLYSIGSTCADTSFAYMTFTCSTPTTAPTGPTTPAPTGPTTPAPTGPTTPAPTGPTTPAPTAVPTTPAPANNNTASHITFGMAALAVPLLVQLF